MVENRAWLEIDLTAIRANVNAIRKLVFPSQILACVKADAYGLGAARVAPFIEEEVSLFGVATPSEGMELRKAGVKKEILVLGLVVEKEDIQNGIENNLTLTIADYKTTELISRTALSLDKEVGVHIKIDTGMGRIGLRPEVYPAFFDWCSRLPGIRVKGVFTHFPVAETKNRFTRKQIRRFQEITNLPYRPKEGKVRLMRHTANSAAIFNYPESYFDLVRPGLALYGVLPFDPVGSPYHTFLKPVVTLAARVIFLKWLQRGESVSYGRLFMAKKKTRVATISLGYADGYPRSLSGKGEVLISGKRCPVIGTICMDMMMVDVSTIKDVKIGDTAVLIGKQNDAEIRVEEIAQRAGTVSHEILSRFGLRLARIYKGGEL